MVVAAERLDMRDAVPANVDLGPGNFWAAYLCQVDRVDGASIAGRGLGKIAVDNIPAGTRP